MKLSCLAGVSSKSSSDSSNCLPSPQNFWRLNFHTFAAFTCKIETSFKFLSSSFGLVAPPRSWKLANQFPIILELFRCRSKARCQGLRLKAALPILSAFALLVDVVSIAYWICSVLLWQWQIRWLFNYTIFCVVIGRTTLVSHYELWSVIS